MATGSSSHTPLVDETIVSVLLNFIVNFIPI